VNNYIEIDFASVTSKKCFLIKKSKILLQTISPHGTVLISDDYWHRRRMVGAKGAIAPPEFYEAPQKFV